MRETAGIELLSVDATPERRNLNLRYQLVKLHPVLIQYSSGTALGLVFCGERTPRRGARLAIKRPPRFIRDALGTHIFRDPSLDGFQYGSCLLLATSYGTHRVWE